MFSLIYLGGGGGGGGGGGVGGGREVVCQCQLISKNPKRTRHDRTGHRRTIADNKIG